jgi:PRTRC genetic system protein C
MKVEIAIREFVFEKEVLKDPNPEMTPEEVASFYSAVHPELVTCVVGKPKQEDGKMVYEFKKNAGTKG